MELTARRYRLRSMPTLAAAIAAAKVMGRFSAFRATARVPQQHLRELAPLLRLIAVEKGKVALEPDLK